MRLDLYSLKLFRVCSGWSLLELLIVLALMAIAASVAAPQLYATWQLQSLHDERQRLAQQIRFARLTSLQKNIKVRICWSNSCGSSVGFITYVDANNDSYWQPTETALSQWKVQQGLSFRFNRGVQISFNGAGNTAQSGTMVLCGSTEPSSQDLGYALVLSSSGRLREKTATCL
jgi:type IV fimbrial biogenesis protein FimT